MRNSHTLPLLCSLHLAVAILGFIAHLVYFRGGTFDNHLAGTIKVICLATCVLTWPLLVVASVASTRQPHFPDRIHCIAIAYVCLAGAAALTMLVGLVMFLGLL